MICPSCGDRAVTQPRLGMCNVCFADMQLDQRNRQSHRADQIAALTKVKAREDVRASTAFALREIMAGRASVSDEVLNRAATIIEGREDVLLLSAAPVQSTTDPKLDEMIAAFVAPVEQDRSRDHSESSSGIIIVHGGTE